MSKFNSGTHINTSCLTSRFQTGYWTVSLAVSPAALSIYTVASLSESRVLVMASPSVFRSCALILAGEFNAQNSISSISSISVVLRQLPLKLVTREATHY